MAGRNAPITTRAGTPWREGSSDEALEAAALVVEWKMTSSSASFGGFSRSPAVSKRIPSALPDGASGSHGAACRRLARFHRTTAVSTVAASSMTSPHRDPFEVHDGRPFHEPAAKDVRRILDVGTGPASPERLPVHPITGRGKYGGGNVGGEKHT